MNGWLKDHQLEFTVGKLVRCMCFVCVLTGLSQQGSAGQGRRLVRWMTGGWDRRYGKALERVGMGVRVSWAVRGQVAGVAGLLLCGGGAVIAALGVGHDLRGAGGLGGGGGWREGLRAGGVPHRLWRCRSDEEQMSLKSHLQGWLQKKSWAWTFFPCQPGCTGGAHLWVKLWFFLFLIRNNVRATALSRGVQGL